MSNIPIVVIVGAAACGKTQLADFMRHTMDEATIVEYEGLTTKLRELRLYHWREALHNRQNENACRQRVDVEAERRWKAYKKQADKHIKFVQLLNDFFPDGDNAEADAAKE